MRQVSRAGAIVNGIQQARWPACQLPLDPAMAPGRRPGYNACLGSYVPVMGVRPVPATAGRRGLYRLKRAPHRPEASLLPDALPHQYPMGVVMSLSAYWNCWITARHEAWIPEDDYDSEQHRYSGKPSTALSRHRPHPTGWYMGTFSKVLFPPCAWLPGGAPP